jgi:flagellar biogenesis protein FliO
MDLRQLLSHSSASPQKVLKIVISISVVLLVMWLFMVSRMEYTSTSSPSTPAVTERADSIRTVLNRDVRQVPQTEARSTNIFMNAFTTFLVLIALLAGVWLWSRTRNKGTETTSQIGSFKEYGHHALGHGAQIKIVEINNEIWVLGITGGSVNLLHRYSREEWAEKLPERQEEENSFYNIFKSRQ